ncbi:cytidylate kinase-like family protein [Magnetococcus sp. PR-3]|uniref:cytidylate kinase-like family protein n=1 Tax=Magnetococcus sp. PR-3 TaxID=3120355 RepID=UPI002FCDEA0B
MPHAIIKEQFFKGGGKKKAAKKNPPPLIAISGEYGAGAEDVAKRLAKTLEVQCFDPPLMQRIVEEAENSQALHDRLDELMPGKVKGWLNPFMKKRRKKGAISYLHLVKAIMGISAKGGVIIGMGAHLILSDRQVFRLKIEAGPEYCSGLISKETGINSKAAEKMCARVDRERIKFVKEIYDRFPTDASYYDLVLSAETFSPEQMSNLALEAMCHAGHKIPSKLCDDNK